MIILLGASGFVGQAFQGLLRSHKREFLSLSRSQLDYTNPETLQKYLEKNNAQFLINVAGFTGKPNVDACELYKSETLDGNAVLPGKIKQACEALDLPWGHVSSGCIYTGDRKGGGGFTEECEPNFSFRTNNCSFYSGSKALGEEVLKDANKCYIWRLRIPFNEIDSPRNYITKLIRYDKLLEARNSISQLDEFVAACLSCFDKNIPYGVYNLTNPGSITTSEVTSMMIAESERRKALGIDNPFPKQYSFFEDEGSFMKIAAKTPRSNCVMNTDKMEKAGIYMSPVKEAISNALRNWKSQ